ncbi:hypothetical protein DRN50_05615 [Thermococci archaeon]|nr:MAG: hypothetical protein DRN50_05615 [Thermococci archaeon]
MTTTIAVSKETKEMLRKLGEKGESYDTIIRSLIEEIGWERLDERWNKILKEDEFIPFDEL